MTIYRLRILVFFGMLLGAGAEAQVCDQWSQPAGPDRASTFISAFGNKTMVAIPEAREHSLHLLDALPEAWMERSPESLHRFTGEARPGEYFVFQVGVYAPAHRLEEISASTTGFGASDGHRIGPERVTCFNSGGIGFDGKPFSKTVTVKKGRLQPLWLGVQIPDEARGKYEGAIVITARNETPVTIGVVLSVAGAPLSNDGVDEGRRLARLKWLNSRIGIDDRTTKGLAPIRRAGNAYRILGREINIGNNGLPRAIESHFTGSNQSLSDAAQHLLQSGMRFVVETIEGRLFEWKTSDLMFSGATPKELNWQVSGVADGLSLTCDAHAEFDGFIDYRLGLKAERDIDIGDIRLEIPMMPSMAKYMMGMGRQGGFRPERVNWKWDVKNKNQDMVWLGNVNGGLRLKLKGENYHRPLINVYYKFGPLNLPPSWGNDGKGGVDILSRSSDVLVRAYSGSRRMSKGEILHFDFELLVTPFHTVNRDIQFGDRYYHTYKDVSGGYLNDAALDGANIVNVHHKNDVNPFINYPYLDSNVPYLRKFIDSAHSRNIRLKVYYTTRELTVNIPEFWALRSLHGEIIFPGPGNAARTVIHPDSVPRWLKENLREDYIPAWVCDFKEGRYKGVQDVAVITTPDSRWNNFYLEGLNWMAKNLGIDGVYIDDSALDRVTMQRARKILDDNRPNARVDLHSWNHFCEPAGWTNCLNLYMDMLPYFDLVWIGEGRDYNMPPDHWLIEVSGIPFGLSGQMLEGGGNKWRGMVYGITNRLGWVGSSPAPIWRFWDEFHIQDKEMVGYWEEGNPVHCSSDSVKATLYRGENQSIIALGNWAKTDQRVKLSIDYEKLGIHPPISFRRPAIKDFQNDGVLKSLEDISVQGGEGCVLVFENK